MHRGLGTLRLSFSDLGIKKKTFKMTWCNLFMLAFSLGFQFNFYFTYFKNFFAEDKGFNWTCQWLRNIYSLVLPNVGKADEMSLQNASTAPAAIWRRYFRARHVSVGQVSSNERFIRIVPRRRSLTSTGINVTLQVESDWTWNIWVTKVLETKTRMHWQKGPDPIVSVAQIVATSLQKSLILQNSLKKP